MSFVELVQYLFTCPGVTVFLSNRNCQDPLENFFGHQRQRGRDGENPSVADFLCNTQALRVIENTCKGIRGNCRGGTTISDTLKEVGPLPKRPRKTQLRMDYITATLELAHVV